MIKAFTGTDTYESYHKAKKELSDLSKKTKSGIKIIDADDIGDINILLQEVEGVGMFDDSSVIFAKRLFQNKKHIDYFVAHYDYLNKFDFVIWHDNKLDSKLKITKLLKDNAALFVSDLPKDSELAYWINHELKQSKVFLTREQVLNLIEKLESNKWLIKTELKKIEFYLKNKNSTKLTDNELDLILGFDVTGDIWKFLDYVGNRNKYKAIAEFNKLTMYEENTQMIISMLDREFKLIAQVLYAKENSINLSDLGVNPYVLKKTVNKAQLFNWKEIKNFMKKLFDLDFAIKSGDVDEKIGLTLLLYSL